MLIGSISSQTTSPMLPLLLFMADSMKFAAIFRIPVHISNNICIMR